MIELEILQNLAIAAAIGFLIGFEREWRDSEEKKERSFAGARTFALVAFLGGLGGVLGSVLVVAAFAAVAILTIVSYWATARAEPNAGGTTEVAIFATFFLGAATTLGHPLLAAVGGVAVAILLAIKPLTERWADTISGSEMRAALRLLAISVIVLPLLPDEGYGPYDALNPRSIWLMVVLISGLSFLGYWLTKIFGSHGVFLTGIVGGLASSTATTLSLARMAKSGTVSGRAAASGIVAANVVMIARIAFLLAAVGRNVLVAIWPALLAAGLVGAAAALLLWRGERGKGETTEPVELGNPMELRPAFIFAALLAGILVLSRFASDTFGDSGLYVVALVTGLADVDALTLSAGQQATGEGVAVMTAGLAVLIAAASNSVVKAGMTMAIAGPGAGARVAIAFAAILLAGGAGFAAAALL